MVFAGQVIEHLWADDVAGFLLESHRALRQDGHLVLESPNRRVTEAIGWHHPQHTAELSVDEATRLLTLAGFEVLDVRGILLGYERERHALPPSWEERAQLAEDRPEDSFVWWIVARRGDARARRRCAEGAGARAGRRVPHATLPQAVDSADAATRAWASSCERSASASSRSGHS